LDKTIWEEEVGMGRILLYCKATCHTVENSSENIVFKKKILFQKTLEYWNVISISYEQQQATHLSSTILVFQTCYFQAIANTLFHVVKLCVLNKLQAIGCCQMHFILP